MAGIFDPAIFDGAIFDVSGQRPPLLLPSRLTLASVGKGPIAITRPTAGGLSAPGDRAPIVKPG